jgi:Fe2+ transport system protein B
MPRKIACIVVAPIWLGLFITLFLVASVFLVAGGVGTLLIWILLMSAQQLAPRWAKKMGIPAHIDNLLNSGDDTHGGITADSLRGQGSTS